MTRRAHFLSTSPLVLLFVLLVLASVAGPSSGFPAQTTYNRPLTASGSGPIAVGDINGDGWLDVVVANETTRQLMIFNQTAAGLPAGPSVTFQATSEVREILLADMDGNGSLDAIILGNSTTTIYVQHDGSFGGQPTELSTPDTLDVTVGDLNRDLNRDGRRDLAFVTQTQVRVRFQNSTGDWPADADLNLTSTAGFHSAAVADMNGDTRPDLVIAKPNDLRVYFQGSLGLNLTADVLTNPGITDGSVTLCVRDMNGDGRPDVVLGDTNTGAMVGNVSVYIQEGTTSSPLFTLVSRVSGALTKWFALGDLNDDGRVDLAAVEYVGPPVAVYIQRLTGGFDDGPTFWLTTGTGETPTGIDIGRFSGRPFSDLILRVPGYLLVYEQEDNPPVLIRAIPNDFVFNVGASGAGLIDLRNYFSDDHDALAFGVETSDNPSDLSAAVAADSHTLDFTARAGWYGRGHFQVFASDGVITHPLVYSNVFVVTVNALPSFTSAPPTQVLAGETFLYQAAITDPYPTDDVHTFSLVEAPAGMTIEPQTGLVQWTPAASDGGSHAVRILVSDAYGGSAEQSFEVLVVLAPPPPPLGLYIAVGIVTALTILGIGTLVSENMKYGFLLIFVPLYSKIKREQVLDHFVRGQIYGYVLANPGEHYNAIKAALNLTNGSLAHHLKTLEREQFLKSKRFGLYRRFYPMNMRIPEDGFFAPNEIQKTIMELIKTTPGITQKEIALHLGLTPPTVNYHIGILSEHRTIRVERAGRKTHCYIADAAPATGTPEPVGGPSTGTPRPGAPRP